MLSALNEDRARGLQREINGLEVARNETLDTLDRLTRERGKLELGATRSQRSRILAWLFNDHETQDRLRPLRKEIRLLDKSVRDIERRHSAVADERDKVIKDDLRQHHPEYRELVDRQGKATAARMSCQRLRDRIAEARRLVAQATSATSPEYPDQSARLRADQHAGAVSRQVAAIGKAVNQVGREVRAYGSLHNRKPVMPVSGRNVDHYGKRVQELASAETWLASIDRDVESVSHAISEQKRTIAGQISEMFEGERDRIQREA
jgi:DNA mismatch repair ATPase MutS